MKKFLKISAISVCSVVSLLVITFVLVGLFGPVKVDVGPCSGASALMLQIPAETILQLPQGKQ